MLEQRVEKRGKVPQGLSLTRPCQALSRVYAWNARTSPESQAFLLFLRIKMLRFRDRSVVELEFAPDASNSSVMVLPWGTFTRDVCLPRRGYAKMGVWSMPNGVP